MENGRDFTEEFDSHHTGLTFDSEGAAFQWAIRLAHEYKFNIIRSGRKVLPRFPGEHHHYFTCECAPRCETVELKEKKKKGLVGSVKKRLTASKRVGCDFRGVIRMEDDGNYHVTVFEGRHKHALAYYVQGHEVFTRLTENDKAKIREMHRAHCKAKVIVDALQRAEPEKSFLKKAVYNYTARLRIAESEGRNPAGQFLQLARDQNYVTRLTCVEADGATQLKDLFWCHPDALKLLRAYPNVFCIDATYCTNRYNYALIEIVGMAPTNQNFTAGQALVKHEDKESYLWVMQCFRELFPEGVYPTAIITDRELGLMDPIASVFPESGHVLCMHHVKRMIMAKAQSVMKTEKEAYALCNGAVRRVLEAPTVEMYFVRWGELRCSYGWVPGFIKYMEKTWLLHHKEKIVCAWTNQIMHYGNNTTNRVESAHSALKKWMRSCRGGLDNIFEKSHSEIEQQVKEIKCKLERSRTSILRGFATYPYLLLVRHVSHYCLAQLKIEHAREGVCTHAMISTHGLPCRCHMDELVRTKDFIFPHSVDKFWTKLAFDGDEVEGPYFAYDIDRMVEDFEKRDPAEQFRMSKVFHAEMYPEECDYAEPEVNVTKKGRPSKKKATTGRLLSHWEHVEKKIAASGVSSRASSSGTNGTSADEPLIRGRYDVPEFVREYLVSTIDVLGDGNCGFRCAALKFLGSEEQYVTVRQCMVAEINSHRADYERIYNAQRGDEDGSDLDKAIRRIDWTRDRCTSSHWMHTPDDLFALAQVFRTVVSLYTCDKSGTHGCCTVFPWRGKIGEFQTLQEISIIYVANKVHYILGDFSPADGSVADNPLPPVHPQWPAMRHKSLRVWQEVHYADRLSRFADLQSVYNLHRSKKAKKPGVIVVN